MLTPPLPQNSVFSKRCLMGRKMFSLWGSWAMRASHFLNSISLGSGMMISMAPSSSSVGRLTTLRLLKREWLMMSTSDCDYDCALFCEGDGPIQY